MDDLHDFGTGLRAHLGLEEEQIELLAESVAASEPEAADAPLDDQTDVEHATLEALIAFEQELLERERHVARREQALAARAGALLTAAQSLHDAVVGGPAAAGSPKPGDELARLRRRKSGAA
jgi:hypothetical protein